MDCKAAHHRTYPAIGALLGALILLVAGCASTPDSRTVPSWVIDGPDGSQEYAFFVGSGTSESGNIVDAEERATQALVDEIVRYLGARIEVETTAEVQASLDSFEEQVSRQLRQSSQARLSGLRIIDKYVDDTGGRVSVYILARYERDALEKERNRLSDLVDERDEAVAVPEAEARAAAEAGNLLTAIGHHVEAAVAASDPRIDNGRVKMRRNLADALAMAQRLTLRPERQRVEAFVSDDVAPSFVARVSAQPNGAAVPDARVAVSYPERTNGGRTLIRSRTVSANAEGVVEFTPPPPSSVGTATVTMTLAAREILEPLDAIEDQAEAEVAALRGALQEVRGSVEYEIVSQARNVPTGIVILDTDIAGNPVGSTGTAAGMLQALAEDDFAVQILPYPATNLERAGRSEVLQDLQQQFGDRVDRVVLGVGRIEEFDESNGFLVTVSGSVAAYELETGRTLYAAEEFQRSRGSSSSGAISAAFRSLGAKIGRILSANLP